MTFNWNQTYEHKCLWCGEPLLSFNNNGGRTKKRKVHTNGKCYANLAVYENLIRQLQAYMNTLSFDELEQTKQLLLKYQETKVFFNQTEINLGKSKIRVIIQQKIKP